MQADINEGNNNNNIKSVIQVCTLLALVCVQSPLPPEKSGRVTLPDLFCGEEIDDSLRFFLRGRGRMTLFSILLWGGEG